MSEHIVKHQFYYISSNLPEDTRLLLSLVAVVSGGVVVMALLLILLHCRRRSRAKERTGAQETGKEDRSRAQEHEQEVWPGMEDTELTPEAKVRTRAANEPSAKFSQSRGRHLPGEPNFMSSYRCVTFNACLA